MNRPAKLSQSAVVWVWVSLLVIVLDQITKYLIVENLTFAQQISILPFFNLSLLHNTGAAFSFLDHSGTWISWLFGAFAAIISTIILIWLRHISKTQIWLAIALSLIMGGALGNLIDRIHYGYVIDFLQVYYRNWYWPAFNIADSAITIGACMLGLAALRKDK